ncbi:MAG: 1,4-dihydroxy-2-naphthoate polyprenyltransferase [Ilumatobacteraceae bacterium]
MGHHDPARRTRGSARSHHEGITLVHSVPIEGVQALFVDQLIRRDRGQDREAGSTRQTLVKGKGRVTGVPDLPQRFDELVAARKVDRNEVRHGQKATVAAVNRWILGARPRTLPAAVVPVAIGAGAAVGGPSPVWWRVGPALIVSLALQVGVNYSNDYSDGIRGTDDVRVGPVRLVAGGLAKPSHVKRAALMAFGVAAVAGLILALATTWWLILVGLVAMLAGWGYTGGPKPYGYLGLGELFVFVFFGLVATVGTTYVIVEKFPAHAWAAGSAAGFLACALLVINNLRDIPTDRAAGKRTLAVRLGDSRTRWLYVGCLAAAAILIVVIAVAWRAWAAVALAGFVVAIPPVRLVRRGAEGRQLIAVLAATARTQLLVGLLLALGLALGPIST